ncbi:E3 ubiquitin-protein ligase Hakai isoform X3 [Ochotona curzoniae]|uniref:E3 ubiquitin-protein ligase Hakai isoform X3 n=1 Tax=Ochotona curzoniae TaxID=130825 RepID=UPI001B34716E|nr:E3 ubiquitin-protein ligase Hakai isoform X3 [Ochotona curzoniae]XP_040858200.1 E3 ubiquitin-protein ligase Hakai isoform X3 [Ochotona curzoniae]
MDHSDNELQGTNSSGSLGGLDVRRRIPIKLISKQANKAKPAPRTQRTINRMPAKAAAGFDYNEEERYDCKGGELFGNQRRFPGHLFWDFQINILGEKDDTPVHFCDKCGLPIKIYGRMIPCKHVFCYDCAILHEKKGDKMCPGCSDPVQRIEQCTRGSLFMCSIVQGCKRTYLSQRDLQAHINHRHMRAGKPVPRASLETVHPPIAPPPAEIPERFIMPPDKHHLSHIPPKQHILMPPPPLQHVPHEHYSQPHEDIRAPPAELAMAPPPPRPFTEDQGTLSPPFTQPGGMSPGIWPAPRGPPPPPRMQGPPSQTPLPGPHHPDQTRYRPYYQ